ncbi:Chondroitin proteoglycan 8 [Caenorhabditis elegans]|uniref:Chondroitin proteoglycan 8 n=1 Tax=Caenorhabditis elegans TaxID=6239 RepID=CPG8_CAEEL|nr:Chondroitin proteoglycan 8 [Caenorhabditis elegans]Q21175.2 RecName: Full=Chondroitin proteoglycan 8; Flags: Precursor [Caenorhabditis elegans]ABC65818.1 chondroitin proteoglycan-8 [Caenorhabditis elegans]CCD71030.1 Chondroitin proteoglycan 8 [Caenorhabditis elegans]|eukprot:NP_504264.1 Chondroitin proteoglycan 8 [Caenorhabditis elegans]
MRPFILLALLVSVTVAFNIFRDEVVPEEQLLAVRRTTRDASDSSSDSDEKDDAKTTVTDGSGSGESPAEEQLRRVVRDVDEEASGEGSGAAEVTSVPVRFVRSVDAEGSGSGSDE